MKKERLDVLLFNKGLFDSREKAKTSIMAGVVYVNNKKEDKPGAKFFEEDIIEVKKNINPYVSRGAFKLEKALKHFNINLKNKIAIDVGASTGGFTQLMLLNKAKKVFSIDVGYGQLAWELRNDERVVVMERTNIRYVNAEQIGVLADFVTIDVSFISLKKVLPVVINLTNENSEILCLVKPQFEAGREKVEKHGVVKDKGTHKQVIQDIVLFAVSIGLNVKGLTYSPIRGPEGNIEYLLYLSKEYEKDLINIDTMIDDIVEESHTNTQKNYYKD